MSPPPLQVLLGKLLRLFLAVIALYGIVYVSATLWRERKGPWVLTFDETPSGTPRLTIRHEKLGIQDIQIFAGMEEPMPAGFKPVTVRFKSPADEPGFGKLLFTDLTFLPGVVTLDIFGHEVELLPRTLVINRKTIPWSGAKDIHLKPDERLPGGPISPQKRKQLGREFP